MVLPRTKFIKPEKKINAHCCCCLVAKSCPALCDSMDCSLPGSSVHGILQKRTLEWVAISFSRGISLTWGSNPRLLHLSPALASRFFTTGTTWEAQITLRHMFYPILGAPSPSEPMAGWRTLYWMPSLLHLTDPLP